MTFSKWLLAAALALGLGVALPAQAVPSCPALGWATDCNTLFEITPALTVNTTHPDPNPYDSVEDNLVGVWNNSSSTILSLVLSGTGIFGFDGDGAFGPACNASGSPAPHPCGTGGSATWQFYNGPGTTFAIVNANNGTVFFTGGLAPGAFIMFSLEEPPTTSIGAIVKVPEPATIALLGIALVGMGFARRRS